MKALTLNGSDGPSSLALVDVDVPDPGPNEVRVKLKCAALNRRDVWMTVGQYPGIQMPAIAGSDGSGTIDAVGAGISKDCLGCEVVIYPALEWGDDPLCGGKDFRVLGMPDQGTFAEYICVPRSSIYPKPRHLSWAQAAAFPLAGLTAWRAVVTHGEVKKGDRVLVTGIGGGAAGFALLWAKEKGADVIVTSSSQNKIDMAIKEGAVAGYNYSNDSWGKELRSEIGSIDLVIDSGGGDGMNSVLDTLKNGGRYVFFGATQGNPSRGLNMAKLFFKQIRIQGTTMGRLEEFQGMIDFVSSNKLEPIIDQIFDFTDAVAAHERMLNSEQMGKIVLRFG
jgi:NADPH:quinone reductase-like Zn-dependent oxidoreductase